MSQDKCNCGKPVKYSLTEGESCNEWTVCPTYEELKEIASERDCKIGFALNTVEKWRLAAVSHNLGDMVSELTSNLLLTK